MVWFEAVARQIAINIIGIVVDKPNDVNEHLRQLYFTYSNHWKILHAIWRKGSQLNPGTSITQKFISKKGGRFICEDENPFTITISKTPFYRNL
jgi:hypothetical protein